MKEINKFLKIIFLYFLFLLFLTVQAESKVLSMGNSKAKVTVKVFSSLTCPHCADFHGNIFEKLKQEYIDKDLVRFEHHAFPLDLAALNAEIIIRCELNNDKKFKLLEEIYKKQSFWAIGSDINKINSLIKKIGLDFGLEEKEMNKCLNNSETQDELLNQRINAQKKYKIEATPTIFVNDKKYSGKLDYKVFRKTIEKNL